MQRVYFYNITGNDAYAEKCVKIRFQFIKRQSLIISHQEKTRETWDFNARSSAEASSEWSHASDQDPCAPCSRDFLLAGLTWMAVSWLNLSWQLWDVHTTPHSGLWDYAKQSNFLALMDQKTCRQPKLEYQEKITAMVPVSCLTSFTLTKVFFWCPVVLKRQPSWGINFSLLDSHAI